MSLKISANYNIEPSAADKDFNSAKSSASGNYTVTSGETLYSLMKKLNFKNEAEIRSYLKLSGTQALKNGQTLTLPTAKLETTAYALARKYNITFNELKALNPHIKDMSKLPKGALINVPIRPFAASSSASGTQSEHKSDKPVKTSVSTNNAKQKPSHVKGEKPSSSMPISSQEPQKAKQAAKADNKTAIPKKASADVSKTTKHETVANSQVSPKNIAEKLKDISKKFGAVSSDEFKKTFALINKDNAIEVIEEYAKIKGNKESLIEMILSEVSNKKDTRKDAVMKIYDLVAERTGDFYATPERRKAFENELMRQLNSWNVTNFFMADTKYLDKAIDELLVSAGESLGSSPSSKISAPTSKNNGLLPNGGKSMVKKASPQTKVTVNGHKTDKTIAQVHQDWKNTAKTWMRTAPRPEPVTDANGNITAGVTVYQDPNVKNGVLNGKTIIINPGHGAAMANPKSSTEGQLKFDPGTSNAKMKGNTETNEFIGNGGKPLEEWHVNSKFAADLTKQLVSQGAKVIYITGSVYTAPKAISKYRGNADMVISLHSNSAGDSRGLILIGTDLVTGSTRTPDREDAAFAKMLQSNLNEHDWFRGITHTKTQGLAVLRDGLSRPYKGPDLLIETGNLKNEKDVANLNSRQFREYLVESIDRGIVQYLTGQKVATP